MAKKWVQFNGKSWEEIGSGGGGGSSHTHPNLSLLNSITQAMVTAWQTASSWVTTNGSAVLSHIADTLLHLPSGGTTGQVLKKTASGTEWADESGGGGGGAALVYAGTGSSVTFALNGASAVVVRSNYSSREWSTIIPVEWMAATNKQWGIALSNTYIGLTVKNDAGACTISANYDLTCYRVVGGSAEGITDENVTMTDFDGNLREAFAFAGQQMTTLFDAVDEKISDAPSDGNQYVRQNGAWEEVTGGEDPLYVEFYDLEGDVLCNVSFDTIVSAIQSHRELSVWAYNDAGFLTGPLPYQFDTDGPALRVYYLDRTLVCRIIYDGSGTFDTTNLATLMSHTTNTTVHVTAADKTKWNGKVGEAPIDGKTYGRKDLEWVEIGTGGNIHMSVSGDTLMIDSDTSVTVSGDTLIINT